VSAGVIDVEAKKLIGTTKIALERGIEAARPGKYVGDIGVAVSKAVASSGFTLAKDLAGHGVGYEVHEDPYIPNFGIEGEGEKLIPGLVIAIEPMVCAGKPDIKVMSDGYTIKTCDGSHSAHFEHTIAITEKGNIILTQ